MTEQTRFKYGLIFCGIVLVEAIISTFLSKFPFATAVEAQGLALGVYTIAKSTTNTIQANIAAKSAANGTAQNGGQK